MDIRMSTKQKQKQQKKKYLFVFYTERLFYD